MRLRHAAVLALVLGAGALGSAAPPVDVPETVKGEVGAFVTIRAKTDGKVVKFVPLDAGLAVFPADLLADKKATVVSATKAGKYRVLAYSSVADDPTEPATVTVVIGGEVEPAPKPRPKPIPPDPKPKPDPAKVDSVWVIVVEDATASRTVQTAVALNDPFWSALKPKHDYRHYLSNQQTAIDNGYVAKAKDIGFPAVLILDARDGAPLKGFKLTTAMDVEQQVKGVTK